MSKPLLILNGALAVLAVTFAGMIVRDLRTPHRPTPVPVVTAPAQAPAAAATPAPPESYAVVASKNLFSPTRSEAPATAVAGGPGATAVNVPKPNLYGVVLQDGAPIAYLEDPVTKRVAGYRVGDAVAGGTLKSIAADRVVLARPEGSIDVTLRDPAKPRPVAPPAGQAVPPGAATPRPGTPPQGPIPQQGAGGVAPDGTVPLTSQPPVSAQGPGQISPQPRRPLPPNLLRRLPQTPATDAPR